MSIQLFWIESIERFPTHDEQDYISFEAGVNLIVGELNAGKTRWIQMIDYLLGDPGKPENAFGKELAEKYESIRAIIHLAGNQYVIQRNWKEAGKKTKILVDEAPLSVKEFSEFMLEKLKIPIITVPTGNPYSDRTWPQLSFREIYRHMYKPERLWSDIVQKQNEVTRSAVILQFLGKAKYIYSKEYSELVAKDTLKDRIEAKKDAFSDVLQDVSIDLVRDPSMTVAVTEESIDQSKNKIIEEIKELEARKDELLNHNEFKNYDSGERLEFERIKSNIEVKLSEQGKLDGERESCLKRKSELEFYRETLIEELARFDRATEAASIFSNLKITHCPSCDQTVPPNRYNPPACNLCGQEVSSNENQNSGQKRVNFEKNQINEEISELEVLIKELAENTESVENKIIDLRNSIQTEQLKLRATEKLSIRGLPPEIALIDMELGKLAEKLEQYGRIEQTLKSKDKYYEEIEVLEGQISDLRLKVEEKTPEVNYSKLGDVLAEKMNTYINAVNVDRLSKWKTGRVSVKLTRDNFRIFLDNQPWTVKAGGTKNYVIQLAYHYSLFSMCKDDLYNFPGLLIIDFPPHFSSADDLKGSENYLLKPFVDLCKNKKMNNTQLIVAGRSFTDLENANLIPF